MCLYVEARGQYQMFPSITLYLVLGDRLFSNLELTYVAQPAGQRTLGILLSLLGIKVHTAKSNFFLCEFWGSRLRSLCFHDKHITNRATQESHYLCWGGNLVMEFWTVDKSVFQCRRGMWELPLCFPYLSFFPFFQVDLWEGWCPCLLRPHICVSDFLPVLSV